MRKYSLFTIIVTISQLFVVAIRHSTTNYVPYYPAGVFERVDEPDRIMFTDEDTDISLRPHSESVIDTSFFTERQCVRVDENKDVKDEILDFYIERYYEVDVNTSTIGNEWDFLQDEPNSFYFHIHTTIWDNSYEIYRFDLNDCHDQPSCCRHKNGLFCVKLSCVDETDTSLTGIDIQHISKNTERIIRELRKNGLI